MGQHAKRFEATGAGKGSGMDAVVGALRGVADIVEEWFDPNSSEVVGAMMRFEQGLALLKTAPAHPEAGEPGGEKPKTSGKPNVPKQRASRKAKDEGDDTPDGSGKAESEEDAS